MNYNVGLLERLIGVVAPHECVGCGAEGYVLCPLCGNGLPPAAAPRVPGVAQLWACTAYSGVAKQAVHRLKFERAGAAAEDIARCMSGVILAAANWVVTPVPTVQARVRQRGYDQARLIARAVARHMGAAYRPLLARHGVARQLGSGRAVRRKQMRGAFRSLPAAPLANSRILLIDDVLTTGATIEAAAAALRASGVRDIQAAVFACAP